MTKRPDGIAYVALRFARDGAHLAIRDRASNWRTRGNRLSKVALDYRVPGPGHDSEKADEATRLALVYWHASDALHALADAVFGPVKGSQS